ncbi:MAG: C10 family peptidase [Bacteroidaceae bacterium]|nr:C10 family peptidase [Bacteroidaceae bacterium]
MKIFLYFFVFFLGIETLSAQEMREHRWLSREKVLTPIHSRRGERVAVQKVSPRRQADARPSGGVSPLLTDHWDQEGVLCSMTPLMDGKHAAVGCVALAMAEVMHKWEHPLQGKGMLTYYDSLGCGQVLTARFEEHRYEWDKMLDQYVEGEYTQQQADAAALLCSDCGISVRMKYGTSSGAEPVWQAIALPTYFGYDEGVQLLFRDFYTRDEITALLKRELDAGRPVLISGYNYVGGHAFVIDGYDERDWFHIVAGNPNGEGDGWTPLDCMAFDMPEWYDVDSPESGLNLLQVFVTGIVPENHPDATHTETHVFAMRGMEALSECVRRTDSLTFCVHELCNVGRNLHSDSVAVMMVKKGERVQPVYTYDRTFLLEEVDDTTYTDTVRCLLPEGLEAGRYTLQPMFRDGGTWQAVRTCTGTPNELQMDVTEQTVRLYTDSSKVAYLTLEDFEVPDLILNGSAPDIRLTLKAHNAEFSGRIYLYMEPIDERCQEFYLLRQGVTMQPDEVSVRRIHKMKVYAPKTGKYRLHFLYDNNLLDDKMYELTPETIEVSVLHTGVIQWARR